METKDLIIYKAPSRQNRIKNKHLKVNVIPSTQEAQKDNLLNSMHNFGIEANLHLSTTCPKHNIFLYEPCRKIRLDMIAHLL